MPCLYRAAEAIQCSYSILQVLQDTWKSEYRRHEGFVETAASFFPFSFNCQTESDSLCKCKRTLVLMLPPYVLSLKKLAPISRCVIYNLLSLTDHRNVRSAFLTFGVWLKVPATRPAAEHVLSSFRQIPKVLPICQYILGTLLLLRGYRENISQFDVWNWPVDHTQSPMAQFQVSLAISDVAVRDYTLYDTADLTQLKNYMVDYCLRHPT